MKKKWIVTEVNRVRIKKSCQQSILITLGKNKRATMKIFSILSYFELIVLLDPRIFLLFLFFFTVHIHVLFDLPIKILVNSDAARETVRLFESFLLTYHRTHKTFSHLSHPYLSI